jgi:arabinose-5-phosphate isomerase
MERKGFSADQYRDLHPGGALGRALVRVSDLMHTDLPIADTDTPMKEVVIMMTSFARFGFAGVVAVKGRDGELLGVITDGDLRRHIHSDVMDRVAGDLMTKNPKTVSGDMLAAEALAIMNDTRITSLFVVGDDSRIAVGLLHIHDCLRAGLR